MVRIYPSLISSNLLSLGATIASLDAHCAGFHIDCMDNHFVPNLTWGMQFAHAIDRASMHPSWVHLMVENPAFFIERLALKPEAIVTVHYENKGDILQLLQLIKDKNWRASLALSPRTAVESVIPFLSGCDQILVMAVEPGFSGQPFIESMLSKLSALRDYKERESYTYRIGVDGGINRETIYKAYQAGAEDFGVAMGIFGCSDYKAELDCLYGLCR